MQKGVYRKEIINIPGRARSTTDTLFQRTCSPPKRRINKSKTQEKKKLVHNISNDGGLSFPKGSSDVSPRAGRLGAPHLKLAPPGEG